MKKGLVLCGVTVLFWALYAVYVRYAAAVWTIEPMVFSSVATLTAGLTMLMIAGPGDLGRSTLRDPHTWAYGLLDVASITLAVGACFFATATELVLLLRVDVVFGLILAWLVFGRRIRNTDMIGSVAILTGCALATAQMAPDHVGYAVLLIALASLTRVAVTVISERHPTSNAADTVRKRCRITGMIMLVSALVFLAAVLFGTLVKATLAPDALALYPALAVLPDAAGFIDPITLTAALGLGVLVYAPATYFYLYAVRVAGTETFFMMLVYQPILTIGLERALRDVTPLPAFEATPVLMAAILCVIGGSTFMLGARYLKRPPTPGLPVPID
ncbi:translation-associated GTPase [alpha proteobacterium BAL199]|jgi:drug/metabolite transporter (DMT)-like permease|nr:translation-associated GTPase [alpha proteobacterium BAL199]